MLIDTEPRALRPRQKLAAALVTLLLFADGPAPLAGDGSAAFADHRADPPATVAAARAQEMTADSAKTDGSRRSESSARERENAECRELLNAALRLPATPGTPELNGRRADVLAYAKAEPVLFVRPPEPDRHASGSAHTYRRMLERTHSPWGLVQKLWSVFAMRPELGRSVLLREGYLYADRPELAFALVDQVPPQLLFSDQYLWIQRGERLMHAERTRTGNYAFTDGPERGQRVQLILYDRIGSGAPPPALHRDFRGLRHELGFDRARVVHLTESAIVADLRYGSIWVTTLLRADDARLERVCEMQSAESARTVSAFRAEQARKRNVLAALRQAMLAQVEEGLPFDEPLIEYGQQDGQLRIRWQQAYDAGKSFYKLNDDRYYVFNAFGRPLVPQVCVDLVFDTLERASGTWWRGRGEARERVVGKLDFGAITDQSLRRVQGFLALAGSKPDWFEVELVPERDRIPFKFRERLADYLVAEADRFVPGDIVLIRGYAPWDKPWMRPVMHFHSFFVYESDPITGFPLALIGNPGRALLQTWQFEAFRTPERSIWYRIRPKLDWLESVVEPLPESESDVVPPLIVNRREAPRKGPS